MHDPVPTPSLHLGHRLSGGASLLLAAGLIGAVALFRVLPHAPNVAPVAAAALFAGWMFRSRLLAIATPLAAMFVSDAFIGGYHPLVMAVVYAALLAPACIGRLLGDGSRPVRFLGRAVLGSLAGSLLFFVASNTAVWAFSAYYPLNAAGLTECFVNALPFFRQTALGDLAFAMLFFGGFLLVSRAVGAERARPALA